MDFPIVEIDDDLDKECSALGGLFQQIISEMKVRLKYLIDLKPLCSGIRGVSHLCHHL